MVPVVRMKVPSSPSVTTSPPNVYPNMDWINMPIFTLIWDGEMPVTLSRCFHDSFSPYYFSWFSFLQQHTVTQREHHIYYTLSPYRPIDIARSQELEHAQPRIFGIHDETIHRDSALPLKRVIDLARI